MSEHQPSHLAAERGEPSYVWRDGQERRMQMIAKWAKLDQAVDSRSGLRTRHVFQPVSPPLFAACRSLRCGI